MSQDQYLLQRMIFGNLLREELRFLGTDVSSIRDLFLGASKTLVILPLLTFTAQMTLLEALGTQGFTIISRFLPGEDDSESRQTDDTENTEDTDDTNKL